MKPDHPPAYRFPLWLNGFILVLVGACLGRAYEVRGSYAALDPLWLTLPITALGFLLNLVLALWHGARGRSRQAWPYLWGCLLLACCLLGLLGLAILNAPRKIGG